MKKLNLVLVCIMFFSSAGIAQLKVEDKVFLGKLPKKKLIQLGWEQPSPQILKQNYQMMEASSQFDGITICLRDTVNGFPVTDGSVFGNKEIRKEYLQKSINDLKACKLTKFKHNFLRINTVPGNLKWDDEKAWETVAKNMGVMAWFIKEGGLEGMCYDSESYGEPQFQWNQKSGLTFLETQFYARKRGQQIMTAINEENPSIVMWGLFFFSWVRNTLQSADIHNLLENNKYGLYPAFINGLLDKAVSTTKFVEGNEEGYYAKNDAELHLLYNDAKMKSLALIAPENISKFKNQFSVSFGLYTDMYSNPQSSTYYIGPEANRTRLERFRDRITASLDICDEYVWIYNERYKFWNIPFCEAGYNEVAKNNVNGYTLCEQILPGLTKSFEYAKNPTEHTKSLISTSKNINNLAINGDFEDVSKNTTVEILDWYNKNCPAGYLLYKDQDATTAFNIVAHAGTNNTNATVASGKGGGILIQQIAVTPGEKYAVSIDGKKTGGTMSLLIKWLNDNNQINSWYFDKETSFESLENNVWTNATLIITVPPEIKKLNVLIVVKPQNGTDKFYFDNIKVVEVNGFLRRN